MSWKKRLGLENGFVISEEVDKYLKSNTFKDSTLSPRFYNEISHVSSISHHDAPCLRLRVEDPKSSSQDMTVYVNSNDAYMEVQTSNGSLDRSYHIDLSGKDLDIGTIDSVLDELTSK